MVSLALPQVARVARLSRGAMIEQLHANYVRTARAKGLRERLVLLRHALPGAMLPVVSYLGPMTAALLTGLGGDRDDLQHPGHRPLLRAERA